jgi:hypothetical protein
MNYKNHVLTQVQVGCGAGIAIKIVGPVVNEIVTLDDTCSRDDVWDAAEALIDQSITI